MKLLIVLLVLSLNCFADNLLDEHATLEYVKKLEARIKCLEKDAADTATALTQGWEIATLNIKTCKMEYVPYWNKK